MAKQLRKTRKPYKRKNPKTETKVTITKPLTVKRSKSVDELDKIYSPEEILSKIPSGPSFGSMVKELRESKAEIDASVYCYDVKSKTNKLVKMNRDQFLEAFDRRKPAKILREAGLTTFDTGAGEYSTKEDSVPILGGPFNKQLYLYDYLKMHNHAFRTYHEEPFAMDTVNIIHDFTLGRGFRVDVSNDDGPKGKMALALWRAFEEVNDLQKMMSDWVKEREIYGEHFIYQIPDNYTKDHYQLRPDQEPAKGIIPRVMLIDPSTIWEVITFPEDISRVLAYQQVYPTQYQLYTSDKATGEKVSGSKFIYRQLQADSIIHSKINCVSNEKRGRSTFYPIIGYLKRLKDSINYSLLSQIKQSAWSIDTEIDGNQEDIDAYTASVESLGNIPAAGSEFIHSTKVQRKFIANEGAGKSAAGGGTWDFAFSMACIGVGIPQQYYGTHLSGGTTKATAIVATEPVAKKFECKQQDVEKVIKQLAKNLFSKFGVAGVDIEVTFPEVVVQNRTEKIKDVAAAKQMKIISNERASNIIAKELQITNYDFKKEQEAIKRESLEGDDGADPLGKNPAAPSPIDSPLTAPAKLSQTGGDVQAISNKTKNSVEKSSP